MKNKNEDRYTLTPWGCLYMVLTDYGIDVNSVPGIVGKHIVEDFMEEMCKTGYAERRDESND